MFNLKKVFEKKFDGTGFLQWYQPTFESVAMAEKLYDNLTGVEAKPKMPCGPVAVTSKGDDQVTVYDDPDAAQLAVYNMQHDQWRQNSQQLMGYFSPTMKLIEIHGSPTLSVIYGDFLKTITFTLNQQNPLGSIAKLKSYFKRLDTVGVDIPELIKPLILVQAIPKVWEVAASKCLHDYSHLGEVEVDDKASSHSKKSGSSSPSSSGSSTGPAVKPALTLDHVQDAIMVEYERLNPQFTGRLTAVKRGGTNTPLFQQQQRPRPPQCQQQQQQNNQQQRAPSSNQDKGKKKKQQQRGTRGGIDRDVGNAGGNRSGNCPHGHSHFASVASTITPPFSSVTKHKDWVALNATKQSLRAEIASENTYPLPTSRDPWAGYVPPSTWDETYLDLNLKAMSCLPSSHARGSPPPASFKGFWDDLCDSTPAQAPPPPPKKKNPIVMQKFTGFKPLESVFQDVREFRSLADRIGVPKTARYLKPLKDVVASEVRCSDQLASKARTSLQDRIGPIASSSKQTLEEDDKEDDGPGYSSSSSRCACSIGPDEVDEDVDMGDGNDLTFLFGDDVDDDIAEAAGVEEDVLDNVSLGSFYDDPLFPYLDLLPNTDTTSQ
ncbi:hypothetical protein PQX77_018139 [Marasmius sp. AFHP31]|nr:hypothetical protein PQX77_018139 [Marasmius sp. AFHP31]